MAAETELRARMSEPLLRLEDALERMLGGIEPLSVRRLPLGDALGLVLAEPVDALLTLPPWDNSAMDGFAVRVADVRGAGPDTPVELAVIGEVAAGHEPDVSVAAGSAVRILTGGMMPAGADAVVPVEDTDAPPGLAARPDRVAIHRPAEPGSHVRSAGGDLMRGDRLLPAGTVLGAAHLALAAASGNAYVWVHRRPTVAVLSTGDELIPVGEPLRPAQIHDSNSVCLIAQAAALSADVVDLGICPDDRGAVQSALRIGIQKADTVIASGGVSVGAHDVVRDAFESVGRVDLWRIAVQPGKPLAFGRASRTTGQEVLLFGLPGNPVSSFVTFEVFVRPVLRRLAGHRDPVARLTERATLTEGVTKAPGRRAFLRVRLDAAEDGRGGWLASLAGKQGSHVISALAQADGLAIVPEEVDSLPAGSTVEVIRLGIGSC